ncbi:hypothetical protein [Brevibacterium pigmentatum]|uniref:hypothetical protein n=1 Tax=Brevibacterium pigmentatum TaxID=1496080 RepID=UPI0014222987|nr:hypothetical protein [Brevibacterium pigmentatum]
MPWGKIDDKLYSSPKWMTVSKGGKALWVSALSWCMAQLTDGAVTKQTCFMLGASTKDARSLVEAGLWDETPNGYQFHDWLDYQPSRQQVLAERESARQRQQRARDKASSSRKRHGVTNTVTHGEVQPLVTGDVTVPPTRPVPTPIESATGRKRPARPLSPDWVPTDTHRAKASEHRINLPAEVEKFRNWAESKDERKANWNAAFTNWLIRTAEQQPRPPQTDLWSKEGPF